MIKSMKVVIASHRLPVQFAANTVRPSDGGLVTALTDAGVSSESLWFGHLGQDALPAEKKALLPRNFRHVPIGATIHDGFYNGYCNQVIWPGFHDRLDLLEYSERGWRCYEEANRRFAEAILAHSPEQAPVWIHDYHLMLLPRILKERQPLRKILFFSHIPWPAPATAQLIPRLPEAAHSLGMADAVAFHTARDTRHFREFTEDLPGPRNLVTAAVRTVPIGISAEKFQKHSGATLSLADSAAAEPFTFIGVDRFDYSKGLEFKFLAFHDFLELNPHYREKVVLRQLLIPTRETIPAYKAYQQEVLSLASYINRKFGNAGWRPVQALVDRMSGDRLRDFYRAGDVCLVTSRKDGMNLVSLEYLASQDPQNPGVLILSDQAGASEYLPNALAFRALRLPSLLRQMHRALEMPRTEKMARWQADMSWVQDNSARSWALANLQILGIDLPAVSPLTFSRHASAT